MKKFTKFIILFLYILVISLSIYSQSNTIRSGDQLWSFHCGSLGSNCMQMYPKFFERVEDELAGSSAFYESIGFKNSVFLMSTGVGTTSKSQTGPHLMIKKFSNTNKGDERCKSGGGELASYVTGGGERGAIHLRNFQIYNMFDNDDGKDKLLKPCPFNTEILRELITSISHETFHGYQYSAEDLNKPPSKKSAAIAWIDEATAEAAAYEYTKRILARANIADGKFFYDLPLHDDDPNSNDKGYRRGHFMYEVGKTINSSSPLKWMVKLYNAKPQESRFGYDWLDEALKNTKKKNLSENYINFIAKKANKEKFYKDKKKIISVLKRDEESKKDSVVSDIMAATMFKADFKTDVFRSISDALPGEYAALLEIKIKPKNQDAKPVLIVEDKIAQKEGRKKYFALAALNDKPKKLLSRAVNAPKKNEPLEKVENEIEVSARTVQFTVANCMAPNRTRKVSFEPEMPKDVEIKMSAKFGKIDRNFNYTAPNREVTDELKVELLIGNTKTEKLVFAKPRITRKGCQYRLLTADGYTITFDPGTETTKTEGQNKREFALFDREFVYVKDPSMGWLKMRPNQMQQMLRMARKSTIGFPSVGETFADVFIKGIIDMQEDPLKWGKAPYDFLDWLERSKLNKKLRKKTESKKSKAKKEKDKKPKVIKEKGKKPCPSSGGQCTVYSIEGGSKVYYDRRNRIDAISTKNGIHKVEYGAYAFEIPKNAQLIQF